MMNYADGSSLRDECLGCNFCTCNRHATQIRAMEPLFATLNRTPKHGARRLAQLHARQRLAAILCSGGLHLFSMI